MLPELGPPGNVVPLPSHIERHLDDALATAPVKDTRALLVDSMQTFLSVAAGFAAAGGVTVAFSAAVYGISLLAGK